MYGLLIVGGDAAWRDELWTAVEAEAQRVLSTTDLQRLDELPSISSSQPAAVGHLRAPASSPDDDCTPILKQARRHAFGVLPVVHDLATATRDLPELLHPLNAMA